MIGRKINWEAVLEGSPVEDLLAFDVHAHMDANPNQCLNRPDPDSLVKTLDKLKIKGACVSSNHSFYTHPRMGNEAVLAACSQYPGRLYGYYTPSPFDEEFEPEYFFAPGSGMAGIKIHAELQQVPENDERFRPWIEYADSHGLPVLFHAWTAKEAALAVKWAEEYTNCPLILGHAGFTSPETKAEVTEAIRRFENVYIDTCISSTYDGAIEWIVSRVGADRVLFGTDLGFFDCRQTYGKLALCRLSDEEKCKIFGLNAQKLFCL